MCGRLLDPCAVFTDLSLSFVVVQHLQILGNDGMAMSILTCQKSTI